MVLPAGTQRNIKEPNVIFNTFSAISLSYISADAVSRINTICCSLFILKLKVS